MQAISVSIGRDKDQRAGAPGEDTPEAGRRPWTPRRRYAVRGPPGAGARGPAARTPSDQMPPEKDEPYGHADPAGEPDHTADGKNRPLRPPCRCQQAGSDDEAPGEEAGTDGLAAAPQPGWDGATAAQPRADGHQPQGLRRERHYRRDRGGYEVEHARHEQERGNSTRRQQHHDDGHARDRTAGVGHGALQADEHAGNAQVGQPAQQVAGRPKDLRAGPRDFRAIHHSQRRCGCHTDHPRGEGKVAGPGDTAKWISRLHDSSVRTEPRVHGAGHRLLDSWCAVGGVGASVEPRIRPSFPCRAAAGIGGRWMATGSIPARPVRETLRMRRGQTRRRRPRPARGR